MKKIFIYAYTQMNLGDDLFVKMLCERYSDTKFYIVCSRKTASAFKRIKNIHVIPSIPYVDGIFRRLKINFSINSSIQKIASFLCDAIVNIGGSLFIETDRWRYDVNNYKKRFINNKPYFVIGSNFGPYLTDEFLNNHLEIFNKVEDICFRDIYSYKLFKELSNVRYANDVIFSYKSKTVHDITEKKSIAISIIDLEKRNDLVQFNEIYQEKIVALVKKFIEEGYNINFVGFCKKENDDKIINLIIKKLTNLEKQNVKSFIYDGDIEEILNIIAQSEYVIATRFHSMILGWVYNKKVYPIVYSEKSVNAIQDMAVDIKYSKIDEISNLQVEEVYEYMINSQPICISKEVIESQKQFEKLDILIKTLK